MAAAPSSISVGGTVTLSVDVKNLGPGDASGVVLDAALPSGLRAVSATSTVGSCDTSVRCSIGALPVDSKATATIVATGTEAGTFTPSASAAGSEPDPDAGNDAAASVVTVKPAPVADLSVALSDAPDPVVAGGTISYTARINNGGPNVARDVTFTDPLPPGLTLTSLSPTTRCTLAGGTISCAFGSLGSGGNSKVFITVRTSATRYFSKP